MKRVNKYQIFLYLSKKLISLTQINQQQSQLTEKVKTELARLKTIDQRQTLIIIFGAQNKGITTEEIILKSRQHGLQINVERGIKALLKEKLIVKVENLYFYSGYKQQQIILPCWIQNNEFNQGIISTATNLIIQLLKKSDLDKQSLKFQLNQNSQLPMILQDNEIDALLQYLIVQQKVLVLQPSGSDVIYTLAKSFPVTQNVFDKQICIGCPFVGDSCPASVHIEQCEYIKEWLSF